VNLAKLKEAEAIFLSRYPGGFDDPGLAHVRRRHNVAKLTEFTRETLTPLTFSRPDRFVEALEKIVSRSSMVSRFEKPPFKAMLRSLATPDRRRLADAFEKRLAGRKKREGFDEIVDFLAFHKLARWSVVSCVPYYYAPTKEAFVKPTTAKKIVAGLEAEGLEYGPRPSWQFYDGYRKLLLAVKREIDPSLGGNNAGIAGFLMTTL
jgi:hypothetical protein